MNDFANDRLEPAAPVAPASAELPRSESHSDRRRHKPAPAAPTTDESSDENCEPGHQLDRLA